MINLLKHEIFIQNKVSNLFKNFLIFFIFCNSSLIIINNHDNIADFGIIFSLISIPLSLIGINANLLKNEIEDGSLEILLTTFNTIWIVIVKYFNLLLCVITAFILNSFISYLLFNMIVNKLFLIIIAGTFLAATSSAITILISSVQCYFHSNTTFLTTLLMPLIIPTIILSGMLIESNEINYSIILLLIGINCIIIPISLYFSCYLIGNIYNI